jgi:hypothetical protein
LSCSLARHKSHFLHPLKVRSHAVGVQVEAASELERPGRALELAQQRE